MLRRSSSSCVARASRCLYPVTRTTTSLRWAAQATTHDFLKNPIVEIDPWVIDWQAPKDWTNYEFPTKISELGETLLGLEETDQQVLYQYMSIHLEWEKEPPQMIYAAPVQDASPQAAAPAPVEEEKPKEKSSFKLVLKALTDDAKIKVLKEVRVLKPGMKLLESKALVDKLPSVLKEDMPKAEADEWVKKLQDLGATVELQ